MQDLTLPAKSTPVDLTPILGLQCVLDEENSKLHFQETIELEKIVDRSFQEVQGLYQSSVENPPELAYRLYYAVRRPEDAAVFEQQRVRFDLTLFPPFQIAGEHNKTLGHIHPTEAKSGLGYPEVYQMVHGTGAWLLWQMDSRTRQVTQTLLVQALAGDTLVIPPGWYHLTINTGNTHMLLSNLVCPDFTPDYQLPKTMQGGPVYLKAAGQDGWKTVPNMRYGAVLHPKVVDASTFRSPWLSSSGGVYAGFVSHPQDFSFLRQPELHDHLDPQW